MRFICFLCCIFLVSCIAEQEFSDISIVGNWIDSSDDPSLLIFEKNGRVCQLAASGVIFKGNFTQDKSTKNINVEQTYPSFANTSLIYSIFPDSDGIANLKILNTQSNQFSIFINSNSGSEESQCDPEE